MKIKLLRDTAVRFSAGQVLEVAEQEARRLLALGLIEIAPVKAVKKTAQKKKEG